MSNFNPHLSYVAKLKTTNYSLLWRLKLTYYYNFQKEFAGSPVESEQRYCRSFHDSWKEWGQ